MNSTASLIVELCDGSRSVEEICAFLTPMLPPGSSISFRVDVKAPDVEGEFELLMTLVQEHVIWFDSVDPSNGCCANVKVVRAESGS